jgi:choline dehydrogenase
VVDSSIFPTTPNGNLNGPTLMVAEKLADVILGNEPLTPIHANVWMAPDWQNSQRQSKVNRNPGNT